MSKLPIFCCVVAGLAAVARAEVSFKGEVAPILVERCQTCHSPEKNKGAYRLDSFETMMKAGESKKPPIVAGRPGESHLFQLITTSDEDDRMPAKGERLTAGQISVIQRWIAEGAKFDGEDPKALLVSLVPAKGHPQAPEKYPRPVPVMALAFSPDGKELAVGGYHEVSIWDPTNGKLVGRIGNIAQRTQRLADSPDGTVLAAAGGAPGVLGVVFTPDGEHILSASRDKSARVLDAKSGVVEHAYLGHEEIVYSVAVSGDGKTAYSAGKDKKIHIWAVKDGKKSGEITGFDEDVFDVVVGGKFLFACSADKKVRQFEGKELVRTYPEFGDWVYSIAYDAKNNRIAAGSVGGEVGVWYVGEGGVGG